MFKKLWALITVPFKSAKVNAYIKRLTFAYKSLEKHPDEGPEGQEREITLEVIAWLIRYYKGDADARTEGTPDIKLNKILRVSPSMFTERELVTAKILSHWIQYKHIEGY